MSIITQALKKAQHEQRLQQTPQTPYGSLSLWRPRANHRRFSPPSSRRFSGLIVAGVGLLCSVGIVTYFVPSARDPFPIAMTVPVTAPLSLEAELTQPQSTPAPSPRALNQLSPESLPPISPPHSAIAKSTPRPISRTLPGPPATPAAQDRAPLKPVQTAGVEPDMSRAAQRARAQRQFYSGIEAYNAGAFDAAEAALQQAIALDPTLKQAFTRLGNLYYQREAYQQALAMYQEAIALDPDYVEALNNLGNTYMQLDMSAQAITELHKAISADRESGLTYYNMACVYARVREPKKAILYLEMAITREPEARHWAKTDTDFTTLRSTSAFQKLLGTSS
jgi:hypothetical protein